MADASPSTRGRVGLVIVTHNSAADIARCLEAVSRQTRRPDRIIVADSGSADGTMPIVADTSARVGLAVECLPFADNVGFAVGNNRAVERLHDCELIALLNPDAFAEPQWLGELVAAAATFPDAASFASRLMVAGRDDVVDGLGDAFHASGLAWRIGYMRRLPDIADGLVPHSVFAPCAAAALYRRDDWVRAGGFDERFFCYAEDVDLGFRLQLLGRGCRYVPGAVVFHVGSAVSGVDSAFSVYHGYRNLEWALLKDMPSRLLWRYLPLHVIAVVAQLVLFTSRGRGASVLRAKWDALRQVGAVLRDRRRVQATRIISDAALDALLDHTPLRQRFALVRARRRGVASRPLHQ